MSQVLQPAERRRKSEIRRPNPNRPIHPNPIPDRLTCMIRNKRRLDQTKLTTPNWTVLS